MRKADLVRLLETIPKPPAPKPGLEQVRTPADIAAQWLHSIDTMDRLAGKTVLDLGCGTGILSWGAAAMGAHVIAVDLDAECVALAQKSRPAAMPRKATDPEWIVADLTDWNPPAADLVLMNPPFGAQKENRSADRLFYECGLAAAPAGPIWFLAQTKVEKFLAAWAQDHGMAIHRMERWDYPLEAFYEFHASQARVLDVGAYRMAKGT